VVGVERDPAIAAWGAENLATVRAPWASISLARPGALGTPGELYDRVLVSAAADALPRALVDQLAVGGRMVVPVRHTMLLVDRDADAPDGFRTSEHGSYSFVPLVEDPPPHAGPATDG
jgi:protein-L-isoaspartate(D-aspartate) O-methyltransferase